MAHNELNKEELSASYQNMIQIYRAAMQDKKDLLEMIVELKGSALDARIYIDDWYKRQINKGRWKE